MQDQQVFPQAGGDGVGATLIVAELDERGLVVKLLDGVVMQAEKGAKTESPSLLDAVALLMGIPAHRLARGQVGTILPERAASMRTSRSHDASLC
jgi:hypothetical protein